MTPSIQFPCIRKWTVSANRKISLQAKASSSKHSLQGPAGPTVLSVAVSYRYAKNHCIQYCPWRHLPFLGVSARKNRTSGLQFRT